MENVKPRTIKAAAEAAFAFEVECVDVKMGPARAVVLEKQPDGTEGAHDCMRDVSHAQFVARRAGPESHPLITLSVSVLGDGVFQPKVRYRLRLEPIA